MTSSNRSFLFVTWDGGGNLPPAIGMAQDLVSKGHSVRFLGHGRQRATIEAAGFPFRPFERSPDYDAELRIAPEQLMPFFFDHIMFEPLMAVDLEAEIARMPTDGVVVDCMLPAPLALLESQQVPTGVLVHTLFRFFDGWDLAAVPGSPRLAALRSRLGLPPAASLLDTWRSASRVLVVSPREFDPPDAELPANTIFVGPVADRRHTPGHWDAGWGPQSDHPLVLVSFSTTAMAQEELLDRVAHALSGLPVRVLVTTGKGVDRNLLHPARNTIVREFVPHTAVLPYVDLMVCHAGHGTVMAALAAGVPLLCLPMGRDQPMVAARVEAVGAGLSLDSESPTAAIRATVEAMLADPRYRTGARQMASIIGRRAVTIAGDELVAMLQGQSPYDP